jgi:hypothetical protein
MSKNAVKRYRLARKVAIVLAAAPLFQLGQCNTVNNRIGANFVNALPSVAFQILLNFALLPIQLILSGGQTGGTGNNGGFGGSGI